MHRAFISAKPAAAQPKFGRSRHLVCAVEAPTNGAKPSIGFDDLVDVIKAVDSSDVIELELKGKKFAMTVRKQEALKSAEPIYIQAAAPAPVMPVPAAPAPAAPAEAPAPAPAAAQAPAPAAAPAAPSPVRGVEVVSPMSGTLYRSPAPGEPAFAKEGDKVVKGQTICIIEAMKLMNEIEAEVSGTLIKFVADNNKMINAGDVIVVIEP